MRVIDFRLRPPFGAFRDLIVFRDSVRTARLSRGLGFDLAPSVQTRSMDLLLSEMDAGSVKCGVITGRTDTVFGSVGNDVIEQVVAAYPGKFIGIAYIAPHNRKVAIEEIERAMAAGFKGVVIEPGLAQPPMYLDDGRLYPVYAHLEDRKIPLVFMAGGNAGPDTTYSSPEHIDRVARDFPDLTIVSAHGNWPWVSQIIHICYRRPNVYLSPDMYLFGGLPGASDYINAANGFMADRFIYGSAYPVVPVDQAVREFLKFPLKDAVIDRILYANAARLLGLE
jgi:predicted TIM-barrel fold metal-dependent hydrolase